MPTIPSNGLFLHLRQNRQEGSLWCLMQTLWCWSTVESIAILSEMTETTGLIKRHTKPPNRMRAVIMQAPSPFSGLPLVVHFTWSTLLTRPSEVHLGAKGLLQVLSHSIILLKVTHHQRKPKYMLASYPQCPDFLMLMWHMERKASRNEQLSDRTCQSVEISNCCCDL